MTVEKEYLDNYIYYDESSLTGIRWKVDIWVGKSKNRRAISKGDVAGCLNKVNGYYQVRIERKTFRIHRLIPVLFGLTIADSFVVDHKDGVKTNNDFSNLRIVDLDTNAKNRIGVKSNVGIPYIHHSTKLNRYQVTLVLDGQRKTRTFPMLQSANALERAIAYLLSKEQEMLDAGYTSRQIDNIKKGINDNFS